MHHSTRLSAILAACLFGAACHDSTAGNGDVTATANDPIGDTFGTSGNKQWDITSMTIARDTGGITVTVAFTTDVILPVSGDTTAVVGYVDFDTDQNPATGQRSLVDIYRPDSGSTGIGVDYSLDLTFFYAVDSTALVLDSLGGPSGYAKAVVSGKTISVRIPRSALGNDDGHLNAAAVFGTATEPTDIVPNDGHLHVGGAGARIVNARRVGAQAVPEPNAIRWRSRFRTPQ